jgi:hypothetical protein
VQQQDVTRADARLDHTLTSKNNLFFRYSIFDAFTALPPLFGNAATGDTPSRAGKGDSRNQSMVFGDVHIFSGTAINEFRASYARIANSFVGYDYRTNAATDIGNSEHQSFRCHLQRTAAHRNQRPQLPRRRCAHSRAALRKQLSMGGQLHSHPRQA